MKSTLPLPPDPVNAALETRSIKVPTAGLGRPSIADAKILLEFLLHRLPLGKVEF